MEFLLPYSLAFCAIVVALVVLLKSKNKNSSAGEWEGTQLLLSAEKERTGQLNQTIGELQLEIRAMEAALAREQQKTENLDAIHLQMKNEFKVLAQEVLRLTSEQMTQQFKEGSKSQMDLVLAPFKEKLDLFAQKVETTHQQGQQERISLKTEVLKLVEQNEKLKNEAAQLTKALRGDVKLQGNWGEMILEQMLEKSGLTKGQEYEIQQSTITEDGKRYQPDVILNLPEGKHIVIDSKVSLVAFERFANADNEDDQRMALKEHVLSLRAHIKGLAEKNYQSLKAGSLDFVALFVPIEGAYAAALQAEPGLFQEAFDRNIVLVSTANLWATLRTVGMVWRQEKQNSNVQEIIRQASNLYDKFISFTEDLRKVGTQMDSAKLTYVESMKKLTEGRGNLVTSVEKLRMLGLKNTKSQNPTLLDRASAQEIDLPEDVDASQDKENG